LRPGVLSCPFFAGLALLAGGVSVAPAASGRAAGTCIDPVVHDTYDGLHVGVPRGWYLSTSGNQLFVYKDYSYTTEAVVQPALLRTGQSPGRYLAAVTASLGKLAAASGNSLSFKRSGAGATVTGHAGSTAVSGAAGVDVLPASTAHGSGLALAWAYWAPTGELASERRALASVAGCYGVERGTLLPLYKDANFTYALPPGWKPAEQPDELFLNDGQNASANFLLVGPFQASSGVTDAQSLVQYTFGKLGLSIGRTLSAASVPSTKTVTGATQEEKLIDFLGTVGGKAVHGLVRVNSVTGGGVTSGVLRIALARPALWNSLNAELVWLTFGIQHDFAQDEAAILHVQQQLAGFARQVVGFDQALNGTDIVEDPTTGKQYEAPYNAYDKGGPQGPGYYRSSPAGPQKLKIITPGS
jgi:hypothetical protein